MACHSKGVKRVVYSASSSCYGNVSTFPTPETHPTNPLSPYGLQKYVGEQYCKMFSEVYGLDTCSLRYFNVYGEKMSLEGAYCLAMGIFAKQMLDGKPLTITNDGNQRRDFTYVGDVVEANFLAATYPSDLKGESFNIGNGNNFSINEIADMLGGVKTYGEKRLEPFQTLADNSKAKNILGWNPELANEFKQIQQEQYELFAGKMMDYGLGNIALGSTLEEDEDKQLSLTGIWLRCNDKVNRLKNMLKRNGKNYVNDEPMIDSFVDISNYGIIAQLVMRNKWKK